MANLTIQEARPLFTQGLIATYDERVRPTSFLSSFFPVKMSDTKSVSIQVRRGKEKIAVDVLRGSEGNRNTFGKSTQKIFIPPYYKEWFDATDLDLYDRTFGSVDAPIAANTLGQFVEEVADKYEALQDKIERRYELQAAQVFRDGIVTMENGTNIDFKRKAASKVLLTGDDRWGEVDADIIGDFETAAAFLRNKGKAAGSGSLIAILGTAAMENLLRDAVIKERLDFRRAELITISSPQTNAAGGTFHGMVTAGSRNFELWTYDEVYLDENDVEQSYWLADDVVILPKQTEFVLAHAAVPRLRTDANGFPQAIANTKGTYTFGERIDITGEKHVMDIKSAGVMVPVSIDKIYTIKTR